MEDKFMYYIIYKITNQIDGKYYIGSHKTKDLNDDYMGSGKYLKRAVEKYGIENFKKEILFVYDNPESMYSKEAEIVNEDFLATENTYNLKKGGFGGWDYINNDVDARKEKNKKARMSANKKIKEKYGIEHIATHPEIRKKLSYAMIKRYSEGYNPIRPNMTGYKHTEETKRLIGKKNSLSQKGIKNSQYGKMWITNGVESKTIVKTNDIPNGWYKGRKIK